MGGAKGKLQKYYLGAQHIFDLMEIVSNLSEKCLILIEFLTTLTKNSTILTFITHATAHVKICFNRVFTVKHSLFHCHTYFFIAIVCVLPT